MRRLKASDPPYLLGDIMRTHSLPEQILEACFAVTWLVLGVVAVVFFSFGTDVALKRKWYPRLVILSGNLFGAFATAFFVINARSLKGLGMIVLIIPAVTFISYLNIKLIKFCDKCGAMLYGQNPFAPMKFCSKCGAELNRKPSAYDDILE